MKQLIKSFALIIASAVLIIPIAIAQKAPFTGTIVFDVKSEGNIPEMGKAMTANGDDLQVFNG